jgi:hypothetical protein
VSNEPVALKIPAYSLLGTGEGDGEIVGVVTAVGSPETAADGPPAIVPTGAAEGLAEDVEWPPLATISAPTAMTSTRATAPAAARIGMLLRRAGA